MLTIPCKRPTRIAMNPLLKLLSEISLPLARLIRDYPRAPKSLRLTVLFLSAGAAITVGLTALFV